MELASKLLSFFKLALVSYSQLSQVSVDCQYIPFSNTFFKHSGIGNGSTKHMRRSAAVGQISRLIPVLTTDYQSLRWRFRNIWHSQINEQFSFSLISLILGKSTRIFIHIERIPILFNLTAF